MTATQLTERQDLALRYEALVSDVSVAELRRRAIAAYADDLLDDPAILEHVDLVLQFRSHNPVTLPAMAIGKPATSHHSQTP